VVELFPDEAMGEALRRVSEVGADCERAAVDARFDLAFKERLCAKLLVPSVAGFESRHRRDDVRILRIHTGYAKKLQRNKGREPVGGASSVPRPVRALKRKDSCGYPFVRYASALRRECRRRSVREIAHRLPANGRI